MFSIIEILHARKEIDETKENEKRGSTVQAKVTLNRGKN